MTAIQIISLALGGISLLTNTVVPFMMARRAASQPQPLPLPPNSQIPAGVPMGGSQHQLLGEAGKILEVVLSQKGSTGLQQLVTSIIGSALHVQPSSPAATATPDVVDQLRELLAGLKK